MKSNKVIYPKVVAGGAAVPLGKNFYYMTGKKHKDGGIDVGKNPKTGLEVEDGEVMHLTKSEVKVFSSVPFLDGKSPAQKVLQGDAPNKVFNAQESFKNRNNINDDGTMKGESNKKPNGGRKPIIVNNLNDPRLISYKDSLILNERGADYFKNNLKDNKISQKRANNALSNKPIGKKRVIDTVTPTINNYQNTTVKGKLIESKLISVTPGKRTANYKDTYKKPVQPVVYQKSLPIIKPIVRPQLQDSAADPTKPLSPTNVLMVEKKDGSINQWGNKINADSIKQSIQHPMGNISPTLIQSGQKFQGTPSTTKLIEDKEKLLRSQSKRFALGGRSKAAFGTGKKKDGILPSKDTIFNPDEEISTKSVNYTKPNFIEKSVDSVKTYYKENPDAIGDTVGIASNVIGGLIANRANNRMLDKLEYSKSPYSRQATKLKTSININPQLDKMRETVASYEKDIDNNTASSRVGLARKQRGRVAGMLQTNELYGNKENLETELINRDKLNQQQTADANINDHNQWEQGKASFKNAIAEKRSENTVGLVETLNSGVQDVITRGEKRKATKDNMLAMSAAHPNVNPRILKELGVKSITDKMVADWDKANSKKNNKSKGE